MAVPVRSRLRVHRGLIVSPLFLLRNQMQNQTRRFKIERPPADTGDRPANDRRHHLTSPLWSAYGQCRFPRQTGGRSRNRDTIFRSDYPRHLPLLHSFSSSMIDLNIVLSISLEQPFPKNYLNTQEGCDFISDSRPAANNTDDLMVRYA